MTDSTPMSRLRELHRMEYSSLMAGPWCRECTCTWPCDVIAALDALEARIDAATVLIRQALHQSHAIISLNGVETCRVCGSPFGTSIDTCPNCQPFRAWLAGDKEAGK